MVVTTVGANAATTGPRGIHGDINDVLFPVLHGTLWYTGMTVVPPLVINDAVRLPGTGYETAARRLRDRLLTLPDTEPIPFRYQNGGDYDEHLVLRPVHAPDGVGIRIHYTTPDPATQ
jgi:NAD(P)H dehydrogenase (quinone)